jgi:hypothetical protein
MRPTRLECVEKDGKGKSKVRSGEVIEKGRYKSLRDETRVIIHAHARASIGVLMGTYL